MDCSEDVYFRLPVGHRTNGARRREAHRHGSRRSQVRTGRSGELVWQGASRHAGVSICRYGRVHLTICIFLPTSLIRALYNEGYAASPVQPYALGRIVLWSTTQQISKLSDLADARFQRIAIANPQHAPYGQCAAEALKAAGVWDKVEVKLVYGENVAQTAQFVQSGNAQAGIIALSLALSPELSKQGRYVLIPEALHQPLEQGFIITHRAAQNRSAHEFARFMGSPEVRMLMARYGFTLPLEKTDERK